MTVSASAATAPEFDPGTDDLLYERRGAVAYLTFNRPQARNAVTWVMYEGLYACCDHVDGDDRVRVLVLRGAGDKAFVSGTDISQFQEFTTAQHALEYEARGNRNLGRLEAVRKPTIAAIRGYAVGGGAGISMACDLRVVTPDAKFGFPIARTLGNVISGHNFARLYALLGPSRAKEILFTARLIGAEEGFRIGLFNEVVQPEHLDARVDELAHVVAANAPLTIRASKEAINRITALKRVEGDSDLILMCYMSEDFKEGVSAFLEKRKPEWKGR